MRTWVKFAAVGGLAMLAGQGVAADHSDGTGAVIGANGSSADINDLYTWKKNDGALVLVMSLGGLNGIDKLNEDVTYKFNIGRTDNGLGAITTAADSTWSTVTCDVTAGSPNTLTCVLDDGTDQTSATADINGTDGETGDLKVHAGNHKDMFFFNLAGFQAAVADSIANAGALGPLIAGADAEFPGCLDATGAHPLTGVGDVPADATISSVYVGFLTGAFDGAGDATSPADALITLNTSAIVVEIADAATNLGGTGKYLQIWAATVDDGANADRKGRPAINTALTDTLAVDGVDHNLAQDDYNQNHDPSSWAADYVPGYVFQLGIYDGLDTVCGNNLGYGI